MSTLERNLQIIKIILEEMAFHQTIVHIDDDICISYCDDEIEFQIDMVRDLPRWCIVVKELDKFEFSFLKMDAWYKIWELPIIFGRLFPLIQPEDWSIDLNGGCIKSDNGNLVFRMAYSEMVSKCK